MIVKRKLADRPDWKRITKSTYTQTFIESCTFVGYISLIHIHELRKPLCIEIGERHYCIADEGYVWLEQFPLNKRHSVITMFDSRLQVVQWYIDVCRNIGLDERGIPCFDDLFLDVTVLPSGEVILLDAEELDEALKERVIDRETYELSWQEANRIMVDVQSGHFELIELSQAHLNLLLPPS